MTRVISKTAISEEEAIAVLLGLFNFEPTDELEAAYKYGVGRMPDVLVETHLAAFRKARANKRPENVIAEKRAAVQHYDAMSDQAAAHEAAIRDELSKGERSVLKVDHALSNNTDKYITLDSFTAWAIGRLSAARMPGVPQSTQSGSSPSPSRDATTSKPRTRLRDQEDAILEEIRRQGMEPTALPKDVAGKKGVKAAVRHKLEKHPLFRGSTIFDKAWERLIKDGRIGRNLCPSSPQKVLGGDL